MGKRWEYQLVDRDLVDVGNLVKHRKGAGLDPEVPNWLAHTRKDPGNRDVAVLAKSPSGNWRFVEDALNDWGAEGWELVTFLGGSEVYGNFVFKRLRDD